MKKFLFPLVAILLLAACSSSEESDSFKYQIDSSIQVDNLKLQSDIFEGNYYIEAIDDSGNDVFIIEDKAEGYTEDLGFGEKREYPVNGCYIQSAVKKNNDIFILISLYGNLISHPHKFIIKVRNGMLDKKIFFDVDDYTKGKFYPESIIDWYGKSIAVYRTRRTGDYCFAALNKDLDGQYYSNVHTCEYPIDNIINENYISLSEYKIVFTFESYVYCVDMSDPCGLVWGVKFTENDEEIRVNKSTYSLDGNNVVVDVDATTRAGEKKKYHLVLNKGTGELVNPQS